MGKTASIQLALNVPGASVDEIERGVLAAIAVLASAGMNPYDAARASFQLDGYGQYLSEDGAISEDSMTDEEVHICRVWDEAEEAAINACCVGWPEKPTLASLELVVVLHEQPRLRAA
jgi:hypothetical protein